MTFHKSLSAASASNSFPNSFYSLMYDGEMMDKSSLKLNFRICGGLCNMLQIMTNSCCCLNMLLVLKILFITALMGKRNSDMPGQVVLECIAAISSCCHFKFKCILFLTEIDLQYQKYQNFCVTFDVIREKYFWTFQQLS